MEKSELLQMFAAVTGANLTESTLRMIKLIK